MKPFLILATFLTLYTLAAYGQFAFWMDENGVGVVFYGLGGGVFEPVTLEP